MSRGRPLSSGGAHVDSAGGGGTNGFGTTAPHTSPLQPSASSGSSASSGALKTEAARPARAGVGAEEGRRLGQAHPHAQLLSLGIPTPTITDWIAQTACVQALGTPFPNSLNHRRQDPACVQRLVATPRPQCAPSVLPRPERHSVHTQRSASLPPSTGAHAQKLKLDRRSDACTHIPKRPDWEPRS